jgi:hypothetical protein
MSVTEGDYSYVDPRFVANSEQGLSEIRIDADNEWNGVQLKISRISAQVGDDEEFAELSFDFDVTNQESYFAEQLEKDEDFQHYVGDIIVHIIENAFENGDYRIGGDDDTDDDSAQSSS